MSSFTHTPLDYASKIINELDRLRDHLPHIVQFMDKNRTDAASMFNKLVERIFKGEFQGGKDEENSDVLFCYSILPREITREIMDHFRVRQGITDSLLLDIGKRWANELKLEFIEKDSTIQKKPRSWVMQTYPTTVFLLYDTIKLFRNQVFDSMRKKKRILLIYNGKGENIDFSKNNVSPTYQKANDIVYDVFILPLMGLYSRVHCPHCDKVVGSSSSSSINVLKCENCFDAHYCSPDCKSLDAKNHSDHRCLKLESENSRMAVRRIISLCTINYSIGSTNNNKPKYNDEKNIQLGVQTASKEVMQEKYNRIKNYVDIILENEFQPGVGHQQINFPPNSIPSSSMSSNNNGNDNIINNDSTKSLFRQYMEQLSNGKFTKKDMSYFDYFILSTLRSNMDCFVKQFANNLKPSYKQELMHCITLENNVMYIVQELYKEFSRIWNSQEMKSSSMEACLQFIQGNDNNMNNHIPADKIVNNILDGMIQYLSQSGVINCFIKILLENQITPIDISRVFMIDQISFSNL